MKSECATIKNDSEQIKEIHSKWKNADIQQTQIGQIKKLQLSFTEQKNLDFQLPDVFVTTKRILAKPQKSMKINKKTSFSFETSLNNNLQSKQQRNLELTSLQTKYQKFKDLSCSVRTTPQKDSHNQCQSILKNQNFYEIDGIKFPFGLYSMHKKRRNQIQDLLYSNNQQKQKKLDNNDQIQFECNNDAYFNS
ncbi:unnamed protein product [Paramecium sonneborni]|uniref:Uncharacterized protein n=1 Tax=Paramecium sonneborni TaxID=65129 RepID=A0A8S1MF88_9CILI|nr:unnamed protein product [Paramecium sonneborni]